MKDKTKEIICPYCKKEITLIGKGKFREDIGEYEWYEGGCDCKQNKEIISSTAKQLGQLGGLATSKKYGSKHYSEAGKKGMEKRWGKSNNLLKER